MIDPIVEEIHKIREEYAEKFDFDVDAMHKDLRHKQESNQRKVVSLWKDKKDKQVSKEK